MRTRPDRPPSFFRRSQREQAQPDLHLRLVARQRARRLVAAITVVASVALALGVALYLSTPHEPLRWPPLRWHSKSPAVTAAPLPSDPGSVGLQVQRGKESHVFRLHQDGSSWFIEELTPGGKRRQPQAPPEPRYPPPPAAPEKPATLTH